MTTTATTASTAAPAADAPPPITLGAGERLHGFVVRSVTPLPDLRANAYMLEHEKSGARLLHVHSRDAENLFSVTFPTPPNDDTGLPHILEHAVLGGSRRYPVKEPFFEMLKMSMATFINAMTSSLYTVYPVASTVRQDFFNLAEVYFDAVFHPQLTEEVFQREGHHFAMANPSDVSSALGIKGIVYNEMKGAYSSPESFVWRHASNALFPDTPLGRDSGGDPERIPELTYQQFRDFHRTLYQPANAQFFIYGDVATADHAAFLSEKLDEFDRREIDVRLPRQPRWPQPRSDMKTYPVGRDEKTDGKTFITIGWVIGDATDADEVTDFEVLERILLGNEAAPLRKAIIDSKLGADLFYSGFGAGGHETSFHVGLKGSEPDRADKFLALVLDTLREVADGGVRQEQVETALQQLTYHHLEIQTLFPLRLMGLVNMSWPYGGDPLTYLRMAEHLRACRRRYESRPTMFGELIRARLLDNPHRLLMAFVPDPQKASRDEEAFARRMEETRSRFREDELRAIGAAAAELEAKQGQPNPPELLAKLPQLKVADLPRAPRHIPTTLDKLDGGIELLRNHVFANGVNYLHLDFDLSALPPELYAYLPRWGDAFGKLGAAGRPYTEIARRRAASTGGIGSWQSFMDHAAEPGVLLRRLRVSLKTLDGELDRALGVLRDLLFELDPRDADRLRDVVRQSRAWYRTSFINDGSGTALRHSGRGLSPENWLAHEVHGLPQLPLIEAAAEEFDRRGEELMARIEAVRDYLLARGRWCASFTGSDKVFETVRRTLDRWAGEMRDGRAAAIPPAFEPWAAPPREGLAAPVQVSFCAMSMPAPHASHPDAPILDMAARFASLEYMLSEVRFKGNAYGAGCYYGSGDFRLYSFRDPRLAQTLAVFRGLRDYVAGAKWTQADIDRGIIGAAKYAERPIRPAEATDAALTRHLRGDTPQRREERYRAMLKATPAEVRRVLLEQLDENLPRAAVCVVSSRQKLEEANRQMEQPLEISDILPS